MSTVWPDADTGETKRVSAPISLIVSAFAPVTDLRLTLTPQLRCDPTSASGRAGRGGVGDPVASAVAAAGENASDAAHPGSIGDTVLLLIDLGRGKNRLGGSILAQVVSQMGEATPDVDSATDLKNFWNAIQLLGRQKKILAYHDRSDGGLLATAVEMAFAGHTGIDLEIPNGHDAFAALFSEELGAVVQVRESDLDDVYLALRQHGFKSCTTRIGALNRTHAFRVHRGGKVLFDENLFALRAIWSDVTRRISALRDNPACAESEFQLKLDPADPGITPTLTFDVRSLGADGPSASVRPAGTDREGQRDQASGNPLQASNPFPAPSGRSGVTAQSRPAVAVLREQGVNGQLEMAAALTRAGFTAVDVHMTDIVAGRSSLKAFRGIVACGGFSYGDVLGAGEGWAKSILFNDRARAEFAAFFAREDAFALGVCNGCQMMSNLRSIIPGADLWPRFVQNQSERYESRFVSVKIEKSPSVLFAGMAGSVIPIAVAHGEGYAEFQDATAARACSDSGLVAARFVDNWQALAQAQSSAAGRAREEREPVYTERYPLNPNGSPLGMTALTTTTGRVTIMMPHPERVFRTAAMSWHPEDWGEDSPWMKLFYNARMWVG
jgi:phosphoribosylformylglycinamidine synthase